MKNDPIRTDVYQPPKRAYVVKYVFDDGDTEADGQIVVKATCPDEAVRAARKQRPITRVTRIE